MNHVQLFLEVIQRLQHLHDNTDHLSVGVPTTTTTLSLIIYFYLKKNLLCPKAAQHNITITKTEENTGN